MIHLEDNQINQENNLPKSNNAMLIGGVILILIIIGAVVLLGNKKTVNQTQTAAIPTEVQNEEAVESVEDEIVEGTNTVTEPTNQINSNVVAKVITVEAGSYYYNPKEIRVKKGDTVQIVMTAKDMMHDFNIDELGVKMPITKSGETNSVTFVAGTTGEFEYYCSVGQHRQLGQTGTLFVEE